MKTSNGKAGKRAGQKRGQSTLRYRVLIQPDEDGIHVAEVPALPGCISQGRTRAAAIRNIKEAIVAYLESLKLHGEPVPPTISEEVVEISM
jgi:antitoxin HicB